MTTTARGGLRLAGAALVREAQGFVTLLVELLAAIPWLAILLPEPARGPGLWLNLTLVAAFALWLSRRLIERPLGGLRLADRQALLVVMAVLTALVAVKIVALPGYSALDPAWLEAVVGSVGRLFAGPDAVVLTLVAVLAIWWRAIGLIHADADLAELDEFGAGGSVVLRDDLWQAMAPALLRRFQLGIVSLGLAAALGAALGRPVPGLIGLMLGFFLAGLLALALARARAAAAGGRPLGGQWFAVLLAGLGALLLVGLLVGLLVASDAVRPLLTPVEWALRGIQLLLTGIALVLGYAAFFLAGWLKSLIGDRQPFQQPNQPQGPPPDNLDQLLRQREGFGLPPELEAIIQWLSVAVLVGAALYLMSRGLRLRRARGGAAEETRESLATDDELLAYLRRAVLDLFRRLFRRAAPAEEVAGGALARREATASAAAGSVRQVYRELLAWAAGRGWGRLPAQTPREFEAALDPHAPTVASDLDRLTRLYEQARYGAAPLDQAEVERAAALLGRVKAGAVAGLAE